MSKIKKILNIIFEKEETKFNPIGENYKKEKDNFRPPSTEYTKKTEKILITKEKSFITATELSKEFNIPPANLNKIFLSLHWATKEDRWWIVSPLGELNGGKQCYQQKTKSKYIRWNEEIKKNPKLIKAINEFKNNKSNTLSNKEKGNLYEEYITEHYRKLGYFVWEHGKEKGRLDQGIDLIVKKDKEIIFIQCKNWEKNKKFKIDHVRVKASRAEARQFMLDNPLFKGYNNKFRYTLSNDCMHPSAIKYIEENNRIFDYEVIEMN